MASFKTKDLDKTGPKYANTALWPRHFIYKQCRKSDFKTVLDPPTKEMRKDVPCKANDLCVFSRSSLAGNFSYKCWLTVKMAAFGTPECIDFLKFQGILKKMRELDDKIIYALNTRLPTESFKKDADSTKACQELFGELQENSRKREETINKCINFSKNKMIDLRKKKETNADDITVQKELRKEQSKLKLLQVELGVEEVVKDQTSKVIYERCRMHYVPPEFSVP